MASINKLWFILLLLSHQLVWGQQVRFSALHAGEQVPVTLMQTLIPASTKSNNTLSSQPRLLILHFWDISCSASLGEIPGLDSLQQRFHGQLQVVLVAPDSREKVNAAFKKIGYDPKNTMVVSSDQSLHQLFPHITVPHHVWINEKGEVLYITQSFNATDKNVQAALKKIKLPLIEKRDDNTYTIEQPLWAKINQEKTQPVQYASTLTQMLSGISAGTLKIYDTITNVAGIRMTNHTLLSLYKEAYASSFNGDLNLDNRVLLEVKDPSVFKLPADKEQWNSWFPKHLHSYELFVPLQQRTQLYTLMQGDLRKAFGYDARVEDRKVKCLVLQSVPNNQSIITKGGTPLKSKSGGKLVIRNLPISKSLYSSIKYANEGNPLPIIDETGSDNIDLEIRSKLNDLWSLRKELQKYGLSLVEQERVIPMLVITPL